MREQMFLFGISVLGICIVLFLVFVSYFIRRVAPEEPAAAVKRQLDAASVVRSVLEAYNRTGQKPLSTCPLCKQPIELRVKTSESLVRLSCFCGACNGTYHVADSKLPQ